MKNKAPLRAQRSNPATASWVAASLALLAMTWGQAAHAQQTFAPIRSITVSGLAERKVVPDEAHITVNLNAQDKDLAKARSAHQAKLAKLMKIVADAGIDERKVATRSSSLQPIYTYRNENGQSQRVFEGYRAQTELDVTVGDTKKLGALMDKIASAGFEQGANTEWGSLMSVYYTLSDPDTLRDEMLVQAIGNAKAKAQRMASAAGASLGNVYQINENGTPQFQPMLAPMMARAELASAADAKMQSAPPAGEQELQSNVTVTYELK